MRVRINKAGGYSFSPTGSPCIEIDPDDIDREININRLKLNTGVELSEQQAYQLVGDNWFSLLDQDDSLDDENEDDLNKDLDEFDPGDDDPDKNLAEPELEVIDDVEDHLNTLIFGKDTDTAKQIIQDFGVTRLDLKVSKSNTIKNMIAKVVEATPAPAPSEVAPADPGSAENTEIVEGSEEN